MYSSLFQLPQIKTYKKVTPRRLERPSSNYGYWIRSPDRYGAKIKTHRVNMHDTICFIFVSDSIYLSIFVMPHPVLLFGSNDTCQPLIESYIPATEKINKNNAMITAMATIMLNTMFQNLLCFSSILSFIN